MAIAKQLLLVVLLSTVGLLAFRLSCTAAKPGGAPVQRDFRILDYHRGSPRLRTLLHGAEAEYLSQPIPIRGVTIESYTVAGVTSLVARAETCLADRVQRSATSPDPIELVLSGGGYRISGTGFFWSQTNNILIISNQVDSLIRGDLLEQNLPR